MKSSFINTYLQHTFLNTSLYICLLKQIYLMDGRWPVKYDLVALVSGEENNKKIFENNKKKGSGFDQMFQRKCQMAPTGMIDSGKYVVNDVIVNSEIRNIYSSQTSVGLWLVQSSPPQSKIITKPFFGQLRPKRVK